MSANPADKVRGPLRSRRWRSGVAKWSAAVAAGIASVGFRARADSPPSPTTATIENTGQTLTLDESTGSLVLYSQSSPIDPIGTIRGGTVVTSGGARVEIAKHRGKLDGITLAGEALVRQDAWGIVENGLTLSSGRVVLGGPSAYLDFAGNQTLGGSGEVVYNGNESSIVATGGALVIDQGITIRTGDSNGRIGWGAPSSVLNRGVISAQTPGREIFILGNQFINVGTVQATAGGIVRFGGNWDGLGGTLRLGNGMMLLGGDFASNGIGRIERAAGTAGRVVITGNVANGGLTLRTTTQSGSLELGNGAKVAGGTMIAAPGVPFLVVNDAGSGAPATLDAVMLAGELQFKGDNGGTLWITNDLTLASGAKIVMGARNSQNGIVFKGGQQTLGGVGEIVFDANIPSDPMSGLGWVLSELGSLTIGPNVTIRTGLGSGQVGVSGTTTLNRGVISAQGAGKRITLAGDWSNHGTLRVADGGMLLLGGSFETADLGTIERLGTAGSIVVTGILDNTGSRLALTDATGPLDLSSGKILGGRIEGTGAGKLRTPPGLVGNQPTLAGVTLAAPFEVGPASFVNITNGLTLDGGRVVLKDGGGDPAALIFDPAQPQQLGGSGEIVFDGVGSPVVRGQFTIGSGVTVRTGISGGEVGSEFGLTRPVNLGHIIAQAPGKILKAYRVENRGQIAARDGGEVWLWGLKNESAGTVTASNGATLLLRDGMENRGRIDVTDSTVNLFTTPAALGNFYATRSKVMFTAGPYPLSLVQQVQSDDSTLSMEGVLNVGAGFVLSVSQERRWEVSGGGKIVGGTVKSMDGTPLVSRGIGGAIENVTLDADVRVRDGGTFSVIGPFSTARPITVSLAGPVGPGTSVSTFNVASGQTLETTFVFESGDRNQITHGTQTLTLGPTNTIRTGGGSGTVGASLKPLVNNGLISAQTAGKSITVTGNTIVNGGTMRAAGGGSLTILGPLSGEGDIEVEAGSSATLSRGRQGRLSVAGQAFMQHKSNGGGTLAVHELNLAGAPAAWTGKLDLADGALAVDYPTADATPRAVIADQIKSGRGTTGRWDGPGGITSRSAAANPAFALGYAEASEVLGLSGDQTADWLGQRVDATTVLVRYVRAGDANLDGTVGFTDLVAVAQNYNASAGSDAWRVGDFNYDAAVNFSDLVMLAQNYGAAAAPDVTGLGPVFAADAELAFEQARVPEPGVFCAAMFALTSLGTRRSGRRNK